MLVLNLVRLLSHETVIVEAISHRSLYITAVRIPLISALDSLLLEQVQRRP